MPDAVNQLLARATQARRENRPADAKRDLTEAVEICRRSNVPSQLAIALADLGQIERDLHHSDAALQHYEEAVAIWRAEGDPLKLAHTVRHVGDIQRSEGRMELAEPCYREALNLYRGNEQTPPLDLANAIRGMALLKEGVGEGEQARPLWTEARDLYATVGVKEGVAECNRRLALPDSPDTPKS